MILALEAMVRQIFRVLSRGCGAARGDCTQRGDGAGEYGERPFDGMPGRELRHRSDPRVLVVPLCRRNLRFDR